MKGFSKKISYFAVSILMGAIIVSFVLTGFQGFGSKTGEVATVDGTPVTSREYNQALQFTINQYAQMLQAKSLSSQQIKQFRLKESTLQSIIRQKHLLNFSTDLQFGAGKLNIKDEIKEYKVFQTADQFDVTKYKALLKANRLSPSKFEEDIINQIKNNKLRRLLNSRQDSKASIREELRFKSLKMKVLAVSFDKESMTSNLKISSNQIKSFASDLKNKKLLDGLYKTFTAQRVREKKKAKSFKLAKKEIVKKHLQKTNRKELSAFNEKLTSDIKNALKNSDSKTLSRLKKKFKINFDKNHELTPFKLNYMSSNFDEKELLPLFKTKEINKIIIVDSATTVAMLKSLRYEDVKVEEKEFEAQLKASSLKNARSTENSIVKFKEENSKVITSANIFL